MKKFYTIPRMLEWKGIQAIIFHKINNFIQNHRHGVSNGDWNDRWNPYKLIYDDELETDSWKYQTDELPFEVTHEDVVKSWLTNQPDWL